MTLFICLALLEIPFLTGSAYAANARPQVGTVSPSTGTSNPYQVVNFTATYSDQNGFSDIQSVYLLVNTSTSGKNCLYVYYDQNTNKLYLRNDANTTWLGGFAPGSANSIENSYARLDCSKTTVLSSGNTLTVNWQVSLKTTFTGTKNTYLYVKDDSGASNGWSKKGTWKINPNSKPTVVSLSPSSGSCAIAAPTTFTTTFSDANGWQDIQYVYFLVSTSSSTKTRCLYGYYDQNANKLYLRNDANSAWLGGFLPGSANSIENSYVKLDCSKTQVSGSGTTLTVSWHIVFKPTFLGAKSAYLYARDDANADNGWTQKGTWTIQNDTLPSTGTIKINDNAQFSNSLQVTLNLSGQDNPGGSGLAQMQFSNDNIIWSTPENYSPIKSWTLTSGNGLKSVYVKYKDNSGNWSTAYSDTITLDTTLPTGSIRINNGAASTSSLNVTLNLSATDTGSGVGEMQFSNDNLTWSTPQAYAVTKTWTLSQGEGTKTVYVKFKDKAGNWSTTYSDTIALDTNPPTGSITINNGANYTNTTSVTLTLSATDTGSGVGEMQFSNNNSTWSATQAYASTKTWTLTTGDGTKTVYVKFNDVAGHWSQAYSDTIILDTSTSSTPTVTDDGTTTPSPATLHCRWFSSDSISGISEYQYKITQDSTSGLTIVDWTSVGTDTEVTKTGLSLTDNKTYYFSVKAKNGAGLWSGVGYSDGIKVAIPSDTTPPTGPIKINNDSAYTNSVLVTLNLFAEDNTGGSGLSQMQFSSNNSNWSAPESYAATKNWTLTSGDGTKTVYVKYKDVAGNWSAPVSDTIILDTAKPTIAITTPQDGAVITDP